MRPDRHIFAKPVIDAKALAKEIAPRSEYPEALGSPLQFRPPNLLPVEFEGIELYQLAEDYTYDHNGKPRTEKKGRLVDGASVPRLAWSFCPPDGRHRRSAFVHDLDYCLKLRPKKEADLAFRANLIADGVPMWRVRIMYQAVHRFGNPKKSIARWSEPLYAEA